MKRIHSRVELSTDKTLLSRQLDQDKEDLVRETRVRRRCCWLIRFLLDWNGCILSRRQCRYFIWWLVEFTGPSGTGGPSSTDQSRHWWRFPQSSSRTTEQLRRWWYWWKSNVSSKTLLLNYVNRDATSLRTAKWGSFTFSLFSFFTDLF